jgi:hypothetical protein
MESIDNINTILGKVKFNNKCDIFSTEELLRFIYRSLIIVNETPPFTHFTWECTHWIVLFNDILVQGTVLLALEEQCQLPTGLACRLVRSLAGFRQQGRHMAL